MNEKDTLTVIYNSVCANHTNVTELSDMVEKLRNTTNQYPDFPCCDMHDIMLNKYTKKT